MLARRLRSQVAVTTLGFTVVLGLANPTTCHAYGWLKKLKAKHHKTQTVVVVMPVAQAAPSAALPSVQPAATPVVWVPVMQAAAQPAAFLPAAQPAFVPAAQPAAFTFALPAAQPAAAPPAAPAAGAPSAQN